MKTGEPNTAASKNCKNCGTQVLSNARFCKKCGQSEFIGSQKPVESESPVRYIENENKKQIVLPCKECGVRHTFVFGVFTVLIAFFLLFFSAMFFTGPMATGITFYGVLSLIVVLIVPATMGYRTSRGLMHWSATEFEREIMENENKKQLILPCKECGIRHTLIFGLTMFIISFLIMANLSGGEVTFSGVMTIVVFSIIPAIIGYRTSRGNMHWAATAGGG